MGEVKTAWKATAGRLTELGGRVKRHYEPRSTTRQPVTSDAATASRRRDAADRVKVTAQSVLDALSAAAKDPQVKDDVKQVRQSIAVALAVTSDEVSTQAQRAWAWYTAGGSESPRPRGGAGREPAATAEVGSEPEQPSDLRSPPQPEFPREV